MPLYQYLVEYFINFGLQASFLEPSSILAILLLFVDVRLANEYGEQTAFTEISLFQTQLHIPLQ